MKISEINQEKAMLELEEQKLKNAGHSLKNENTRLKKEGLVLDNEWMKMRNNEKKDSVPLDKEWMQLRNEEKKNKAKPQYIAAELKSIEPSYSIHWLVGISIALQIGYFAYLALRHYGII